MKVKGRMKHSKGNCISLTVSQLPCRFLECLVFHVCQAVLIQLVQCGLIPTEVLTATITAGWPNGAEDSKINIICRMAGMEVIRQNRA